MEISRLGDLCPTYPNGTPKPYLTTITSLFLEGDTAGITVAARLRRAAASLDIGTVEPSESHFYQSLWTLVGAAAFPPEASRRQEADFIPTGVDWIRDRVTEILTDQKAVAAACLTAPCRNGWHRASTFRFKSRIYIRANASRSVQGAGGNWNLPATTPLTEMSSSRDSQRSAVPPTSSRTSANSASLASLSRRNRFAGNPMIRWSVNSR